ncbi:unnamed protein product [Spirodela intermedia]|uniref:Uncharacterized protein n=2 Tax=Spirodela intermedia TaxID=51605 RepID=A0A7I8J4C1_SPIIN|nr:unnamed protein product [Spirodela intermedia]CAA6664614.1 unnamed protein product [Spirodela intermedia]CAA7401211.1 unnamed protein product [Spirodela intermedia]
MLEINAGVRESESPISPEDLRQHGACFLRTTVRPVLCAFRARLYMSSPTKTNNA